MDTAEVSVCNVYSFFTTHVYVFEASMNVKNAAVAFLENCFASLLVSYHIYIYMGELLV